jgi:hypothetical protein
MGSKPGRRGGKPAINRLSYGMALASKYSPGQLFWPVKDIPSLTNTDL